MGWSWAVFWCQLCVQRVVSTVPELADDSRVVDGRPVPSQSDKHAIYIDNLFNIGTSPKSVCDRAEKGAQALRSAGLIVHEEEVSSDAALVLGWQLDHPSHFRPAKRRMWRIRIAIRELLRRGWASGRILERLVGQLCFVALGKREIYAVLGTVFAFIAKNYDQCSRIWPSVRRELMLFDSLAPLLVTNLAAPWSDQVHSVDASFWGLGVCEAPVPLELVKQSGRFAERWRFQSSQHVKARSIIEQGEFGQGGHSRSFM